MATRPSNVTEAIRPGQIIPDFCLRALTGRWLGSTDFIGHRLILVFTGWNSRQSSRDFLRQLRGAYFRIVREEAVALLIVPEEADTGRLAVPNVTVPFPILRDPAAMTHRAFGAIDWSGQPAPGVFITNRHRRVIYRALRGLGETLPSAAEVIMLLEYDQLACADCGRPLRIA